ncbi:MAG: DUF1638 domain-containing protein [Actinomycetota bacterium]
MSTPSVHVVACGALAKELLAVVRANELNNVRVSFLPAELHNRPDRIVPELDALLDRSEPADRVLVGYGDCGTGGGLDRFCAEHDLERLPGAHCYEMFGGAELFARLHDAEPGTFYLTDYLARHFDRLVLEGLGINCHPELEAMYFGNYRTMVHLAQSGADDTRRRAEAAADRLGLTFEYHLVGTHRLAESVVAIAIATVADAATFRPQPEPGSQPAGTFRPQPELGFQPAATFRPPPELGFQPEGLKT